MDLSLKYIFKGKYSSNYKCTQVAANNKKNMTLFVPSL